MSRCDALSVFVVLFTVAAVRASACPSGGARKLLRTAQELRSAGSNAATIVSARLLSCQWPRSRVNASSLAGAAPAARVKVQCVYSDAAAGLAPVPGTVPALLTVTGLPLEQCALGVPLQLLYLLRLEAPVLPGAPQAVLSSTPLVGHDQSAAQQAGSGVKERFCLVDPEPGDM